MAKAVLFDWDMTLGDTKDPIINSIKKVLEEQDCIVDDDFLFRRFGIGRRKMYIQAFELHGKSYDEELLKDMILKKDAYHEGYINGSLMMEGALDLLNSLDGRIKMALATMSSRYIIVKQLEYFKLKKYFDTVITVDEIIEGKPDPEIFLKTADMIGVNPVECIVVEDSVFGVQAAKKAGMKVITVPTGAYTKEELEKEGPDMIVQSLCEKEKILEFILEK